LMSSNICPYSSTGELALGQGGKTKDRGGEEDEANWGGGNLSLQLRGWPKAPLYPRIGPRPPRAVQQVGERDITATVIGVGSIGLQTTKKTLTIKKRTLGSEITKATKTSVDHPTVKPGRLRLKTEKLPASSAS